MIPISLLRKKKGFSHLKTQSFLSYHQILYVVLIVFDKPRTLTIKYHVYGLLSCFSHIQLFTTLWLYGLYGLQLACFSHIQLFTTLWLYGLYGLQLARLLCPWNSPGNNTRVGCHASSRDQTHISCVSPALAGGFFTTSTTWEAHKVLYIYSNEVNIFLFQLVVL